MKAATKKIVQIAPPAQGERTAISHDKLFLSPLNVRKATPTQLEELAAQIKAQGGVVQNLIVYPERKSGKLTGRYGVTAGGRRFRAMGMLIEQGDFPADHPMPVLLCTEANAIELSLVENSGREAMHPADEFEAFKALIDEGRDLADIAARFGCSEMTVRRRLKLANLAPEFIDMYRAGSVNLGCLEALAITTDHDLQHQVWENNRYPHAIRSALTQDKINVANSPIARFVGIEAIEAAGGTIERDLFNEGHGYTADTALIDTLATEMLEAFALPYRESGKWAWVEVLPQVLNYEVTSAYSRARTVRREPTAEEQAQIAAFSEQLDALDQQMAELEENGENFDQLEALDTERDTVDSKLDALRDSLDVPHPEDAALAGVLIGIDHGGKAYACENFIRPGEGQGSNGGSSSTAKAPKGPHSARLILELTSQHTAALQEAIAASPRIALNTLVTHMAARRWAFFSYYQSCVNVSHTCAEFESKGGEVIGDYAPHASLESQGEAWKARLIDDKESGHEAIYSKVVALSDADINALLAYLVATSISLISEQDKSRLLLADTLIRDTGLDMSKKWEPTAANYFNSVSRARVLEVLSTVDPEASTTHAALKKGELAAVAEKTMAGKGWIPDTFKVAE